MPWFGRNPSADTDFYWRLARLEPGEKRIAYAHFDLGVKTFKRRGTAYVTDRRLLFVSPGLRKYGFRLRRDLVSLIGWHLVADQEQRGRDRLVIRTTVDDEAVDLVFVPRASTVAPADEFFTAFAQEYARVRQS